MPTVTEMGRARGWTRYPRATQHGPAGTAHRSIVMSARGSSSCLLFSCRFVPSSRSCRLLPASFPHAATPRVSRLPGDWPLGFMWAPGFVAVGGFGCLEGVGGR